MADIFRPRPKPPQRVGKVEAEKIIYTATILAWLALPVGMGALPQSPYRETYFAVAVAIMLGTGVSLFARPRVPPPSR